MNGLHRCFLFVAAYVAASIFASENDGTWSKPLEHVGAGDLYDMCSAGDYLWLLTDRGVGRYHTTTGKTRFYPLSVLDLEEPYNNDWTEWNMAAADSEHVAIFERYDPVFMLYFNGSRWQRIVFPDRCLEPCIGPNGTIWVVMEDVGTLLKCSETGQCEEVSVGVPDSTGIGDVTVDIEGIVWLSVSEAERERIGGTESVARWLTSIYRFDGTTTEKVFSDTVHRWEIFTDQNGKIVFTDDTVLYRYRNGELLPDTLPFPLDDYRTPVFDSDGRIWCWRESSNIEKLTRIDIANPAYFWEEKIDYSYNMIAGCGNGIYVSQYDGLRYFRNNDTIADFISNVQIWGECGWRNTSKILFGKRETIFLSPPYYLSGDTYVLKYGNGTCRRIPSRDVRINHLMERADGSLVISGDVSGARGLFILESSAWQILEGTENLGIYNFIEDKDGRIWSGLDTKILHQTNDGWELIDETNSNLPPIGEPDFYGNKSFVQDSAGFIWGLFEGMFVAKTQNGYDWTIYTTADFNLPEATFHRIVITKNGAVQLLLVNNCNDEQCGEFIRITANQTGWDIKPIAPPDGFTGLINHQIFLDGRGDIWVTSNYRKRFGDDAESPWVDQYQDGATEWIRYDSTNVPYRLERIAGEDYNGNIYFFDYYDEVVVFNRNNAGTVLQKRIFPCKSQLAARNIPQNGISVRYSVNKGGKHTLSMISVNGRLVTKFEEGLLQPGLYCNTFNVSAAPGIYFVRFETPEAAETVPLVIR